MTRRAINIEPLTPASQHSLGDGKRHVITWAAADSSGVKVCVRVQLASGHSSLHRWPSRTLVGIKITHGQRLEARLIVHVLAAAGENPYGKQAERRNFSERAHLARHLRNCPRT